MESTWRGSRIDLAAARTVCARLGIRADAYLLGFLGRFMEQKGFEVLVKALRRILDSGGMDRLWLLAVGSGDYAARIQGRSRAARRPCPARYLSRPRFRRGARFA